MKWTRMLPNFQMNRLTRRISLLSQLAAVIAVTSSVLSAQPSFTTQNQTVSSPPSASEAPSVSIKVESSQKQVSPGSEFVLAVILDHAEHYHTNLNKPIVPKEMGDFYPVATSISLPQLEGTTFGGVQWPQPTIVDVDFFFTGTPIKYQVYAGRAIAYVPVSIASDAPVGARDIELKVTYQACDETTCLPPTTETHTIQFEVVASAPNATQRSATFDGYNPDQITLEDQSTQQVRIERKFLGLFVIPPVDSAGGIVILALSAAIGGFILNLTPCVLPVIPIKVMTISKHAGESRSRAFMLSMWMALGVIVFWVGIGIPVAFVADFVDPSIIFGIWWITAIIGIVILLMGAGIMGLFQINLPQKVYMVNPKADSAQGSFVFGIMTAVLGLPCFGFVAGALLAGAATMPAMLVLTIFAFMGIGMAFPYVILAMFPKMVSKLPRTGPASELIKHIMGLLMIAAAAYFLGTSVISFGSGHTWTFPWWGKAVHWWIIGVVGLATGFWLIIQTIRISKRVGPRVVFGLIGLLFALSGAGIAYNQTMHQYHNFWLPFTPAFLASSLDNGHVVVLDFTAEWCLNCKTLEATVLSKSPVKPELLSADVVPMVADLTSISAPGWEKLKELGQTGIPLLVVYAPGSNEPIWMSNAYNSAQVVDAITRARSRAPRVGLSGSNP